MIKFSLSKCEIELSFLFVAGITCSVVLDSTGYAIWGILAAMLHECGHIAMMVMKKTPPSKITFGVFNVDMIDFTRGTRGYRDDIHILFAGCAANILIGSVLYCIFLVTQNQDFLIPMITNILVGVFNLLPVEPLDGGQVIYALITAKHGTKKAETAVNVLSFFCLLPVAIAGFYVLLQSKYNFSLLFISCYLMAVLLLKKNKYY